MKYVNFDRYTRDIVQSDFEGYNRDERDERKPDKAELIAKVEDDYWVIVYYPDNQIGYVYGNSEIGFNFSLLSEVGRLYQTVYSNYFQANGIQLDTIELENYPYLTDIIGV